MHLVQMQFIQDFLLMIIKGFMSLFVVESLWLRQMVFHLYVQVQFSFWKQLIHEHFHVLLKKTMEVYVLPTIG
jgi:hypothetical protein